MADQTPVQRDMVFVHARTLIWTQQWDELRQLLDSNAELFGIDTRHSRSGQTILEETLCVDEDSMDIEFNLIEIVHQLVLTYHASLDTQSTTTPGMETARDIIKRLKLCGLLSDVLLRSTHPSTTKEASTSQPPQQTQSKRWRFDTVNLASRGVLAALALLGTATLTAVAYSRNGGRHHR